MITKTFNMYIILTQTDISYANQSSVAIQCNLINAPPLEKLPQASDVLEESFCTETEPEETDLDTFCSKTHHIIHSARHYLAFLQLH